MNFDFIIKWSHSNNSFSLVFPLFYFCCFFSHYSDCYPPIVSKRLRSEIIKKKPLVQFELTYLSLRKLVNVEIAIKINTYSPVIIGFNISQASNESILFLDKKRNVFTFSIDSNIIEIGFDGSNDLFIE